ncbi:hypothetical protein [Bdellovibrio sp. HCB2-146]|uniref:hypothetical protein n=1 Tax=Bdellovibrio sp. HCB2-146 TaxID=3394362 RepID=UPI0039BCBA0F
MNKAIRVTLFVGGFVTVMVATAPTVLAAPKTVTDSLVRGLSCQNLSVNSIYKAIREDAFDESRNMPITNWEYSHNGIPLGNCWALSSTQRMFSYLARYNESNSLSNEARVQLVLDMVRRSTPKLVEDSTQSVERGRSYVNKPQVRVVNSPLKTYKVFEVEGDSVNKSYDFWWALRDGFVATLAPKRTVKRAFRDDIQVNQGNHFFRAGNLGMGLGGSPTSAKDNYETIKTLLRNLDGKRLTLMNLRMERTNQHIVMAKSYVKNSNGLIEIKVYDSNQPEKDQILTYNSRTGVFTSEDIAGLFYGRTNAKSRPLGVFIVDEEERGAFEQAMLAHYRTRCN